jgi:catechol 2,3-dioxygenase-like lactoylglutathione lyase family enzyme
MIDVGLTHIALPVADVDQSIRFYATYANMQVAHRRADGRTGSPVVWLCDRTRPFVIVLIQTPRVSPVLSPLAHLGVGCASQEQMDALCAQARQEGVLIDGPKTSAYPVGYWAFLRDPDGHTLELSFGQEVGLTIERLRQLMDNLPPLTTDTIWAILDDQLEDATVNRLVWYYLGYRDLGSGWDTDLVSADWKDAYPEPPDFIESRPATVKLTRSIPQENKQLLKEQLGFAGYKVDELIPRRTRRATMANWLLSYMQQRGAYGN